jgi:hypothetical protein
MRLSETHEGEASAVIVVDMGVRVAGMGAPACGHPSDEGGGTPRARRREIFMDAFASVTLGGCLAGCGRVPPPGWASRHGGGRSVVVYQCQVHQRQSFADHADVVEVRPR